VVSGSGTLGSASLVAASGLVLESSLVMDAGHNGCSPFSQVGAGGSSPSAIRQLGSS